MDYHKPPVGTPATADAGEFRHVKMDDDTIMDRLSGLYASPESALRELIANEITAARKARELGANPTIEVTVKPDLVRVQGIDSLGITRETFEDVYMHLGRSGNFDGGTPGQFGFGRISYMMLSDEILVETHPRGEPPYAFVGTGGRGYRFVDGTPDIPVGTRASLVPRGSTRYRRVWAHVGNAMRKAAFGVPMKSHMTYVDLTSGTDILSYMAVRIAERSDIPVLVDTGEGFIPGATVQFGGSDRLYAGELPGGGSFAVSRLFPQSYLCGMPIGFTYSGLYPIGDSVCVDITDERKYPPTPDRERFTGYSSKLLSGLIDGALGAFAAGFPTGVREALDHPDRPLAEMIVEPEWLERRVAIWHDGFIGLGHLGGITGRPIINCAEFEPGRLMAVLQAFPKAAFVRGVPEMESLESFMGRHGIPRMDVMVVHGRGGSNVVRRDSGRHGLYRVSAAELESSRPMLERGGITLTTDDVPGLPTLAGALRSALGHTWETSRGDMTGRELLRAGIPVYRTRRRILVERWGDGRLGVPPGKEGMVETIMVLDGGTRKYRLLQGTAVLVRGIVTGYATQWGSEAAIEAYLTLETPVYRDAIIRNRDVQQPDLLDGMLAMEGKGAMPRGSRQ